MRGTLRGVRSRVERLAADVQRGCRGLATADLIARIQVVRQKGPADRPAETADEIKAKVDALWARREEGYL